MPEHPADLLLRVRRNQKTEVVCRAVWCDGRSNTKTRGQPFAQRCCRRVGLSVAREAQDEGASVFSSQGLHHFSLGGSQLAGHEENDEAQIVEARLPTCLYGLGRRLCQVLSVVEARRPVSKYAIKPDDLPSKITSLCESVERRRCRMPELPKGIDQARRCRRVGADRLERTPGLGRNRLDGGAFQYSSKGSPVLRCQRRRTEELRQSGKYEKPCVRESG